MAVNIVEETGAGLTTSNTYVDVLRLEVTQRPQYQLYLRPSEP